MASIESVSQSIRPNPKGRRSWFTRPWGWKRNRHTRHTARIGMMLVRNIPLMHTRRPRPRVLIPSASPSPTTVMKTVEPAM